MLNDIYTQWLRTPPASRYRFIRNFKDFLKDEPGLRHIPHDLFKEMITYHIRQLKAEGREVQIFLNKRLDARESELADLPRNSGEGFDWMNRNLNERLKEIHLEILEYQEELTKYERLQDNG